jgi:hypothetical protein
MQWGDVLQEAYLVYARVCGKYPDAEAKHLMSLFKTAWVNHYNDLATKDAKHRTMAESATLAHLGEVAGETDNEGHLRVLVRQAPNEVRMVLNLFLNAPQEIVEALTSQPKRGPGRRPKHAGNERINKALGLPAGTDVLQMVHKYLCG